jgi:O-antigen/teichoic acid export membrane protein
MNMSEPTWKMVDILVACLIALVTGALFSWWMGAVVFLIGLVIVFRQMNKRPSLLSPKRQIMEEEGSGEWLEEWHDDMRRWQIGPYEWRD